MSPTGEEYLKGSRFILCDLICDRLLSSPIVILDAGALDALVGSRWTKLPAGSVQCHGFEPDLSECDRLNNAAKAADLDFHFYPVALAGHTGPAEFYRYAEPAANSFYPPNHQLIGRWCYTRSLTLASQFALKEKSTLDAVSLDDWSNANGVPDIDFIKLNVQGAELDILRGAQALMKNTLGLLVEQTFNATYIGAPLFGEVYDFISSSGFCMFDIVGMNRVARTRSPIHVTEDRVFVVDGHWPHHQFLEGHFFYLRDPITSNDVWTEDRSPSLEKCLKLACLAETFGQIEYAFEILEWIAVSPQAGRHAAICREIVETGAAAYRKVSAMLLPGAPSNDAQALLMMGIRPVPTIEDVIGGAASLAKVAELTDRLQAAEAENTRLSASLRSIYESTTWRTVNPLMRAVNWIKKGGRGV
jgi:FkbM family methyltransferase